MQGWLHPFSANYIAELSQLQREEEISGACAEIGIHHGRLFILLHLASAGAKDLAIDVFDDQHLNTDLSGRGNLALFLDNVRQYGGDEDAIHILQKSSLDVSAGEVRQAVGPIAIFSIDGGHTAQCALNDLRIADAALHDVGVVILDDFFNEAWPEVCVGATDYFRDPTTRLRPFAITPNKLYLCRPAHNEFYRTRMQRRFSPRLHEKDAMMFGETVSVMGASRHDARTRLRHWISDTTLGSALKILLGRKTAAPRAGAALRATDR